jgi:factor associated with neutral sphingomyelinase activation
MEINNLSGRSYCDLTQYPVVPWILVKFGNKFDITDENNYRNFLLPMGALGS